MHARTSLCSVAMVAGVALLGGCTHFDSTLTVIDGGAWRSVARRQVRQYAHVGQPITFEFLVNGPADYAEVFFGHAGHPITVSADSEGVFRFQKTFDMPTLRGDPVAVASDAFLIRSKKDRVFLKGEPISIVEDVPDRRCAKAKLSVVVYQSEVRFTVPAPQAPTSWNAARLTLHRPDAAPETVYPASGDVYGFVVAGPNEQDACTVVYHPRHDQITADNRTKAVLAARGADGVMRTWEQMVTIPIED